MRFTNRVLVIAAVAAIGVTILASGSAMAVRGGNGNGGNGGGGNYSGTITFADGDVALAVHNPNWGDSVMFAVDANVKERDMYNLWAVNRCSQDGVTVSLVFAPVDDGLAGPVAFEWMGGGAADCTVHVETFEGKPIRGAEMTYSVGP